MTGTPEVEHDLTTLRGLRASLREKAAQFAALQRQTDHNGYPIVQTPEPASEETAE